jgi:hypothetical protein
MTEGPDRDPTWLHALPTEGLFCFMKHVLELAQGMYLQEIRAALHGPMAERYSVERFNKQDRVNQRFFRPFQISYDSLLGRTPAASADEAEGSGGDIVKSAGSKAAESADSTQDRQAEKNRHDSRETNMSVFRKQCEQHCARELEARMVFVVAQGSHAEIGTLVKSTNLYQHVTEDASCMAFDDVKNAKLCNIYEGEGVIMFTRRQVSSETF